MRESDRVFAAIETGGSKILARILDADGAALAVKSQDVIPG